MHKGIERLKKVRSYLINLTEGLSADQLNEIPAGFNNNILWNFGHLIATLQNINYVKSGNAITIEEKYMIAYKPGTKPDQFVDETEIARMKSIMISSVNQFEQDYSKGIFSSYTSWATRSGVEVRDIEDAIHYSFHHDGIHLGYIMALKHLV